MPFALPAAYPLFVDALWQQPPGQLQLDDSNLALAKIDLNNQAAFCAYVENEMKQQKCDWLAGGYGENRTIYRKSEVFDGQEARSLHLGVDFWMAAQNPVYAPVAGRLHSFANNARSGDYGPTLILEHERAGGVFYTLYGHLSTASLAGKTVGDRFEAGALLGWLGEWHENVHWPPHLHFQLILDMGDYQGDFPGVCSPSDKEIWQKRCPDPNLLLSVPWL
ncbi:MAG: peptidoglycan DD-metalloendopeptidase family protein [Bacteroidia bacterium]